MAPGLKKVIIIIGIIAVLSVVYVLFFKNSESEKPLISGGNSFGSGNLDETRLLGSQISQALIQIESLKLDKAIFESKNFNSLVDKGEDITSEPTGRKNPFAPITDSSVNYSSSDEGDDNKDLPEITNDKPEENTEPSGGIDLSL